MGLYLNKMLPVFLILTFSEDNTPRWYLIRTVAEGKLGWVQANDVIELLRPNEIDFTSAKTRTSREDPRTKQNGPAICEDSFKSATCGQDYVLGFKSQQVVDGIVWFEVVLRDSRDGWLTESTFTNLDLDYLKENLQQRLMLGANNK